MIIRLSSLVLLLAVTTPLHAGKLKTFPDGNREIVDDRSTMPIDAGTAFLKRQTSDSALYVVYDDSYQTARYECWGPTGRSDQWQGITAADVANAAVVRRGRRVFLESDNTLPDPDKLIILSPAPPSRQRLTLAWHAEPSENRLAIDIPADAPVGDYRFEYGDDHCTVYVIFDIYTNLETISERELSSWGYEDSPFGTGPDHLNFLAYGPGPADDWDPQTSTRIYLFQGGDADRHDGVFGERLVELAASIHGWGAPDTLTAGRHLYSIVGQRLTWTSNGAFFGLSDGYTNTFDRVFNGEGVLDEGETYTALELPVEIAEEAALGRGRVTHLPAEYIIPFGQCMNFATTTGALARAIGIPSRPCYTIGTTGWNASFHVWTELLIDGSSVEFPGWESTWWKFDSADERREEVATHLEGSITAPAMDGWSDFAHNVINQDDCNLRGGQFLSRYDRNVSRCDQSANHTSIILKPNAMEPSARPNSLIWNDYRAPECPWTIVDTWSTFSGTGVSGVNGVESEAGGYALNLLMNLNGGGPVSIVNTETRDDLPILSEGIETPGLLGGLGSNFYLVDISNQVPVTVHVPKGGVHEGFGVRLYGSIDEVPHVRGLKPVAEYASEDGALTVDTIPNGAKHLILMAIGEDEENERFDNQVWHEYSLLLQRETSPQVFSFLPTHGSVVSHIVTVSASAEAASLKLYIDGMEISIQPSGSSVLSIEYEWDTTELTPWSEHTLELVGSTAGKTWRRISTVTVREPAVVFFEGFETEGANPWQIQASTPATTGAWVIASPGEAASSTPPFDITQPGAPVDGVQCLFTGRNPGGNAATDDVDDGSVSAILTDIDIAGCTKLALSFDTWWYNRDQGEDAQDYFRCEVSVDGGSSWISVYQLNSSDASVGWSPVEVDISSIIESTATLSLRFIASDGPAAGNLIEAAIDNVQLTNIAVENKGDVLQVF